jgi:hypothetical protein
MKRFELLEADDGAETQSNLPVKVCSIPADL